jgi:hypothetical protein
LAPETPPLPEVISALRRAARPPQPAGRPETGDPDAPLVTGPDGEDLTAEDPYTDLYDALPAPAADSASAAPGEVPDSVRPPETVHPARRELPPGTVPAGVRGDDETPVDIDIAALGGLGLTAPAPSRPPARSSPPCSPRPRPATRGCPP